jgi:hypothetical protein
MGIGSLQDCVRYRREMRRVYGRSRAIDEMRALKYRGAQAVSCGRYCREILANAPSAELRAEVLRKMRVAVLVGGVK